MKSCVSLHGFRISADPLGGWCKVNILIKCRRDSANAVPPVFAVPQLEKTSLCLNHVRIAYIQARYSELFDGSRA